MITYNLTLGRSKLFNTATSPRTTEERRRATPPKRNIGYSIGAPPFNPAASMRRLS
jgi:hypothetical protein